MQLKLQKRQYMKNRNIALILSLITTVALQAQNSDQYLHLNMGGGLHGLSYDSPNGTQKPTAGFTLNTAYSYFFSPNWGLQTGIGIQTFGATSLMNFSTEMPDIDSDGDPYLFSTYYKSWQERQHALWLDIPLAVQFRYPANQKISLLASVGAKFSMPVSATFKTKDGEIQTTGKYPQWDLELTDIPSEGFTSTNQTFLGKMSLKSAFLGTVDAGMLYRLTEKMDLYIGGYANYGLNNIITPDTKYIYQKDGVYNGLFASEQVNAVKPISIGVKVGVYWQITKKQATVTDITDLKPIEPVAIISDKRNKDTIVVEEIKPIEIKLQEDTIVVATVPEKVITKDETIAEDILIQDVDSFEIIKKQIESTSFRFRINSALPLGPDIETMKSVCRYLQSNPNAQLYTIGHTCNTGSHAANYQLGLDRAIMAKRAFIKLGAPAKQVIAVSKSSDIPLVPNTTEENRIQNRRVEFKLIRQ
jgi:outer membrane protein OmpA-like peptidoglycan-associated protein